MKEKDFWLGEYFGDVKLIADYEGYFCSVEEAISIVIVGTFCGFRNLKQIHEWAKHEEIQGVLIEHFGITHVPCYYWLTRLMGLIDPESMNACFVRWVESLLPESLAGQTISFDGKTVCSTGKMARYENPLHIVSAQLCELGLTFGQEAVAGKSNEIPAMQRLVKLLNLTGSMVVADAMNCQRETALAVIEQGADYLLSVKDNQPNLKEDIADYVQDEQLRKSMETASRCEKNRERVETRRAFVTQDIDWIDGREEWANLCCIGAINTVFESKSRTTNEWHYYISSRAMTAEELLQHARAEWRVEAMHWLLDVHFGEDDCRIQSENAQQALNMIRKIVLNSLRIYKDKTKSKKAFSALMIHCLVHPTAILDVLAAQN